MFTHLVKPVLREVKFSLWGSGNSLLILMYTIATSFKSCRILKLFWSYLDFFSPPSSSPFFLDALLLTLNYGSFAQGKTPALSNHLVSLKTWLMLRLCQQTVRADLNILLLSKSVAGLDYCNPHHLGMYYWLGYWPISSPSLVHKSYETDNMGNVIPYAPVTS